MCHIDENGACSNRSWINENNALLKLTTVGPIMTDSVPEEHIKRSNGKKKDVTRKRKL